MRVSVWRGGGGGGGGVRRGGGRGGGVVPREGGCGALDRLDAWAHGCRIGRPSHTRRAAARAAGFRRSMTISEARVWEAIRGKATGARFRRQTPIGPFLAD